MTRRAGSARAASETSRRRVSSRVPNPDARASPLANAPKHRYLIEFLASTRETSRGRPHPRAPIPREIIRARPSRGWTRPVAARPVVTLHDPLRLRRLRQISRRFVSSVSRSRSTRVSIRGVTTRHPPPPSHRARRARRHGPVCAYTTSRDARRRCETIVASTDSTYTALHFVRIRWGRCPTAPFLRLAVVYDVRARSLVGVSSMKQTTAVGPRADVDRALDGCATSRASRRRSVARDESRVR